MPNRFIGLIDSGRIADEAALKSCFRSLAKRIHPDTAGGEAAGGSRAFITLRADYEEALARLAGGRGVENGAGPPGHKMPDPRPYSAREFYEGLEDLLARGFPRAPEKPGPRGRYEASRELVLGLLAGRDILMPEGKGVGAFLDFERGYAAILAAARPSRPMEGRFAYYLGNLVASILYYHRDGSPQPLRYARNEWPRLEKELRERGEVRPIAFLALLMEEIGKGPANLG
jgi:hypothetical protein